MAYNICVNCGTNLNHLLSRWTYEFEIYKHVLKSENIDEKEYEKYFANLFFLKYNIDRLCCRTFFLSFNDYIPSTL